MGKRGRKGFGITKKVSITLTEETWKAFYEMVDKKEDANQSSLLREIIERVVKVS
ncbi:CopG family transcriptional regulator [Brevibacillus daliensis]|uniref:CopG family transcriptional regulator n=1 Tax=Brevibacillus daliensis TaxID=2892995 RepID=UPI001E49599C|nr:CopG family transcriptional regulator [Brevibacillus daliensis]